MAPETIDEVAQLRSEVEQLRRQIAESEAANEVREQRYKKQRDTLLALMSSGILFRADLPSAVRETTEACSDLIGTERVSVWLYSQDCATIECLDLYERSEKRHTAGEVLNSASFPGYTASHRRGAVVAATDVYRDPRAQDIPAEYFRSADIRSVLDAPVWLDEKLRGVLSFEAVGRPRAWTSEDEDCSAAMAAILSLCFEARERKRAEEARQESEQRYRNFVANASEGIYRIDFTEPIPIDLPREEIAARIGRCAIVGEVNEALARMYGLRAADMVGRPVTDFAPEYGRRGALVLQRANYQVVGEETVDLGPNGQPLYLTENFTGVVENGQLVRIWGVQRDISAQKQTENALRTSERFLNSVIEQNPCAIWIADDQGTLLRLNEACRTLLKVSDEEVVGKYNVFRDNILEQAGFTTVLRRLFEQGEVAKFELDYDTSRLSTLPLRQKAAVLLDVTAFPVRDAGGRITNVVFQHVDITERRRAENALRESERRLREVQETARLGSWHWDVKTGDVDWSEEVYRIFGLDPNEFTPRIDSILALSPWSEDHERDKEMIRRAMESHDKGHYEQRFLRPDRSIGYYCSTFQGRYDETGDLVAIVGSVMDITERKQAEQALRDSEAKLRSVFRAVPIVIGIIAADRTIAMVNEQMRQNLGYAPEEVVGTNTRFLYVSDEEYHRVGRALYEHLWRLGSTQTVGRMRRKDGVEVDILFNAAPLQPDDPTAGAAVTLLDITERVQAEREVIQQRRELQQVLQAVSAQIWYLDTDGRVVQCSRVAEQVSGLRAEQVRGGTIHTLAPGWDDPERRHQESLAVARTGQPLLGSIESFRVGDELRWASVDKIPWREADGTIKGVLAFIYDITNLKQAEASIRKLNVGLEQRVIERTAQLEAANKELEAFTYSVSHDLRAPLRHIDGFTRILAKEHSGSLNSEGMRLLGVVQQRAQRMGVLIDDLLALSRLGRKAVEKTVIDVEAMVREVWQELTAQREAAGLHLEVGTLPGAYGDCALLRQVWLNLLDNAIKYSSTRQRSEIVVDSHVADGGTWYRVQDNGVGFDARFVHKLFAVFQRLHREDEFPGTGVALAIVQRIVHKHGGRVRAQGQVDQGATFEFTLGE